MKLYLYFREATRSLFSSLQRTFLALLGIAIGIASVIAMVSIGEIVKEEALRQFQELGTDFLVISNIADETKTGNGIVQLKSTHSISRACPSLREFAPYSVAFATVVCSGKSWGSPVLGITGNFNAVNRLIIDKGRPLSEIDQEMKNCVIGDRIAQQMRQVGITNMVGSKLLILDHIFTIVGVVKPASENSLRPQEINEGVMVPYLTLKRITGTDQVTGIVARLRKNVNVSAAVEQIQGVFDQIVKERKPYIQTASELIGQMNKQMNLLTMFFGIVGCIALVVGGVGVMNVMLVSVAERRREIGIRRALGAKRRDIQGQFIVEASLLCLFGGIAGIALGIGGAYGISKFQHWYFFISRTPILLGFGVSAMVGLFFGFYPAWQAARLRPIEALRAN